MLPRSRHARDTKRAMRTLLPRREQSMGYRYELVGFSHSRPHEPSVFTEGPPQDPKLLDYQHPRYLIDVKEIFLPTFDIGDLQVEGR